MKPENQIQIKRNVYSFSVIVLLLSLLIGSSAWTILGDDMRRSRNQAQDLTHERDSLSAVIDSMNKASRASQNLEAIVEAMTRADQTIIPLQGQYINAFNTAKINSEGLFPIPDITKPSLSGIELQLYEAFSGLIGSLGEYGQLMIDMNSSPQTLQGEISKCRDDLRRRDDEIAQLKAKAGSGTGNGPKPPGTSGNNSTGAATCEIACADCQRVARTLDEVNLLSETQAKFVAPSYKGRDNKLTHEIKYPTNVESGNKKPWIEKQYIDLVLTLNKKFNREIK
jgi:hypothetical protein